MDTSLSYEHNSNANGACYHFKILVPAVAAGAIIGKGGETIAQLQKEAGARVKMSKANDFYPGEYHRQPARPRGLVRSERRTRSAWRRRDLADD